MHVIVSSDGRLLGHVGFQLRNIAVGICDVVVTGTGGVLIRKESGGISLGTALMRCAQTAMRSFDVLGEPRAEFGYLDYRPEIVPFYQATGWRRIDVVECHVSMGKKRISTGEGNAVGKGPGSVGKDPANAGDPGGPEDGPVSIVVSERVLVSICTASRDISEWPADPVDLRGKPW